MSPAARLAWLAAVLATLRVLPSAWRPRLDADQARLARLEAERALAAGDGALALRPLRRVLQSYPDNAELARLEALALGMTADRAAEADAWIRVLRLSRGPGDACARLAAAYDGLGRTGDAAAVRRRCPMLERGTAGPP